MSSLEWNEEYRVLDRDVLVYVVPAEAPTGGEGGRSDLAVVLFLEPLEDRVDARDAAERTPVEA